MAHALQHHQRERLREALLLAGATRDEPNVERPFVVGNVRIGEPYIVAFCETPGHAIIDGIRAVTNVDPDAYSDSLSGTPDIPEKSGTYAAIGLVRVELPRQGKPTLHVTILHYVSQGESDELYQALLRERASPDESIAIPANEESDSIETHEPVLA